MIELATLLGQCVEVYYLTSDRVCGIVRAAYIDPTPPQAGLHLMLEDVEATSDELRVVHVGPYIPMRILYQCDHEDCRRIFSGAGIWRSRLALAQHSYTHMPRTSPSPPTSKPIKVSRSATAPTKKKAR